MPIFKAQFRLRIFYTAFLLAISFVSYSQINSGLVAYWPLDGNIEAVDPVGATYLQTLPIDNDRYGNPCSAELSTTWTNISFKTNVVKNRSLSFWVKRNQNTGDYLFETTSLPFIRRSNDSLRIILFDFSFNASGITFKLESGKWYHVVWTYNSAGQHKVYINNALLHQEINSQSFSSSERALIGSAGCSLDDIRIYEKELSTTEITELYNLPSSCITTSIPENEIVTAENKKVVFTCDVLGKEINEPDTFSGIIIVHYSDGSKKKILNTTK